MRFAACIALLLVGCSCAGATPICIGNQCVDPGLAGDGNLTGTLIDAPENDHVIVASVRATEPVGAIVVGYDADTSYAYPPGLDLEPLPFG